MSSHSVSLVVTDLDGTLWASDEVVPQAHHLALEELKRRNVPVLAATARRPRFTTLPPTLNGLGHLPAVSLDGSFGMADGTVFHRRRFSASDSQQCLDVLGEHGLSPVAYVLDEHSDVIVNPNTTTCDTHRARLLPDSRQADLDELAASSSPASPFYLFAMYGLPKEQLEPATNALRALNIASCVLAVELTYGQWALVVSPLGVTKWAGVLSYCQLRGIDPSKVLTIGDGANDVGMHTESAIAVGITGGHADALAVVDHVVAPPQSGGWSQLLDFV